MMGFMIYFVINMRFFKIFKVFLKSGPSLEKSGKMGKNGEKRLSQNPHYPTTDTFLGNQSRVNLAVTHVAEWLPSASV